MAERGVCDDSDNLINYWAGPLYVELCVLDETITVTTSDRWSYLISDFITISTDAWCLVDEDFISKKNPLVIKLNYKILKGYILYSVNFL